MQITKEGDCSYNGKTTTSSEKAFPSLPERAVTANLLLERLELKRDIALIKADLIKRSEVVTKLGGLLRSSPIGIDIGGQNISAEQAADARPDDYRVVGRGVVSTEDRGHSGKIKSKGQGQISLPHFCLLPFALMVRCGYSRGGAIDGG